MKTKLITTDKASILLVELEAEHSPLFVGSHSKYENSVLWINTKLICGEIYIPLPSGNWSILGMLHTLTDEQKGTVVECYKQKTLWVNYHTEYLNTKVYELKSASESFASLLQANEVYLSNPYGEEPNHMDYKFEKFPGEFHFLTEMHKNRYADAHENWQIAEQKVFRNGLVLISEIETTTRDTNNIA